MNRYHKLDLTGRVAFITGGGGGIGRAAALRMAQLGADIAIADIVPERCDEVRLAVEGMGCKALSLPVDVMDTDALRGATAATDDAFDRLDILVNNAGGVAYKPFLEQSERSWRRHIDINMVSMLAATHAAAPIMARGERGGSIVNVATIEAMRAGPNVAVYAACKAGMVSFTKSMALELSGDEIRVNCIAPDHTVTPGGRGNRTGPVDESVWRVPTPEQDDRMRRVIPLLREGDAEECGDLIAFLCSDMASYITGAIIPIDGGTSAAMGWVRGTQGQWTQMEGQRPDR